MSDSTAASFAAAVEKDDLESVLEAFEKRANDHGGGARPDPISLIIRDTEQQFNHTLAVPSKDYAAQKAVRAFHDLKRTLDFNPPTELIRRARPLAEAHAGMMAQMKLEGVDASELALREKHFKLAQALMSHVTPAALLAQTHYGVSSYSLRGAEKKAGTVQSVRPYLIEALWDLYRARNTVFTRPGLESLYSYHAVGVATLSSDSLRELYFSVTGVAEDEWDAHLEKMRRSLDELEVAILVQEISS